MNTKKIYKILLILLSLFLLLSNFSYVYAAGETVKRTGGKQKKGSMFNEVKDPKDPGLPKVTIDDASAWTERKGFEIIGFLQKFIQPFAIIIFIFCAIMAVAGASGNGHLTSKGLIGMGISLIMYVVVLYAPEIMDWFLSWVQS